MTISLVSAGRMNAKAPSLNKVIGSPDELALFNKIEETLRGQLKKTIVLCPGGVIKTGQDAGISAIAGLYCIELQGKIQGKAEEDRLEYLQKELDKLSSADNEVTETACHACANTKKIDPWLSC